MTFARVISFINPLAWWRRQQRAIDHKILFPQIQRLADGNKRAELRAIEIHIENDAAWQCDTNEYSKRDRELMQKVKSK